MKQLLRRIARIAEPLVKAWVYPIAWLSGRSVNMEKAFLWPVIKCFSKNSKDHVIQYMSLPRDVDTVPCEWEDEDKFSDYAIILQGPISQNNFTVDTLRLYRKCYPGAVLIVSTWLGVSGEQRKAIEDTGAVLIESEPPLSEGLGHVNLQLVSSCTGMRKARDLGCTYAVKTRTDQRLYANDALLYLSNLQKAYPSGNRNIVNNRLVYISYGKSYRYMPFGLCDFIVFGETEELIKLYSPKMDERPHRDNWFDAEDVRAYTKVFFDKLEISSQGDPYGQVKDFEENYFRYMSGEEYIVYHYYCKYIHEIKPGENLLKAYISYLKNYAVVADSEKLLLYWPKYNEYVVRNETEFDFLAKLDFKKWLEIYLNYEEA